jgi:hypothetical protein
MVKKEKPLFSIKLRQRRLDFAFKYKVQTHIARRSGNMWGKVMQARVQQCKHIFPEVLEMCRHSSAGKGRTNANTHFWKCVAQLDRVEHT